MSIWPRICSWLIMGVVCLQMVALGQTMHTPAGIRDAMRASGKVFLWEEVTMLSTFSPMLNSPYTRVEQGEKGPVPVDQPPSSDCQMNLRRGEFHAKKGDLGASLNYYRKATAECGEISHAWSMLAIEWIAQGKPDSAQWAAEKALEINFYDYSAHCALAGALMAQGEAEPAAKELALGWLLNVHLFETREALPTYFSEAGYTWRDFQFLPSIEFETKGDTVIYQCPERWMPFASVLALWRYSPEYRKERMAEASEAGISSNMLMYKEAILNQMLLMEAMPESPMAQRPEMQAMARAVKSNQIHEFIFVELLLDEKPYLIYQQTPETIRELGEYVKKIHCL